MLIPGNASNVNRKDDRLQTILQVFVISFLPLFVINSTVGSILASAKTTHMKNGLIALLITSFSVRALTQVVPDTTNITIGDKTIIVIDSNPSKEQVLAANEQTTDSTDADFSEEKLELTHFAGIDFGFSRLINGYNATLRDSASDWLSLNPNKSVTWRLNILEQKIRLYHDYVGLLTGFSITYNGYGLSNNVDLSVNDSLGSFAIPVAPEIHHYTKNKLRVTSLQVPLMLEFNTSSNVKKHFHFAAGVQAGWVTASIQKQKWENDSGRFTSRRRDDFNINPFTLDLAFRIGFNKTSLFLNYGLQPLFVKNQGEQVFPVSFGIQLTQF